MVKKTKPGVPGTSGANGAGGDPPASGHNAEAVAQAEADRQALYIKHRDYLAAAEAALVEAREARKQVKARLKADGFTVKEIEFGAKLATPEGERKARDELQRMIRVARYENSTIGTQFTFDLDSPDRTPSTDRCFDEGRKVAMEGGPAKPPHSPETEQYRAWLSGHAEGTSARLRSGIKPLQADQLPQDDERDLRPAHLRRRDQDAAKGAA
jgi:hypothetical protein